MCRNHCGAGLHQCRNWHRDSLPLGKPGFAYRRPGRAEPAYDGLAAGLAACRSDAADHQVCRRCPLDRTRRRYDRDGGARVFCRRARPCLSRDPARRPRPRNRHRTGSDTAARRLSRLDQGSGRSCRHRKARRSPRELRAPGHPARHAGVDGAGPRGGDRARSGARHPGLLQRGGARPIAARRSAPFRPHTNA